MAYTLFKLLFLLLQGHLQLFIPRVRLLKLGTPGLGIPPSLFSFILDFLTSERTTVGIESRELNPAFGQLAPGCPGIEKLD